MRTFGKKTMKKLSVILFAFVLCSFVRGQQLVPIQIIEITPEIGCPGDTAKVRFIFPQPVLPTAQFRVGVWLIQNSIILFDTVFTGYISQLLCVDTLQSGAPVYQIKKQIPWGIPIGQWYASGNIWNQNPYQITVENCDADNPCDTLTPPLNHSTSNINYTFCLTGTYLINEPYFNWVRIWGQNCDSLSYVWIVNGGAPTVTPSIIFTPTVLGVTTFTLIGVKWVNGTYCFQYISWSFTTIACTYTFTGIEEYEQGQPNVSYTTLFGTPTPPIPNTILIEQRGLYRRKVVIQSP